MASVEAVTVVEIDMDFCTRTFGVGACNAVLDAASPRKCYNTYGTCAYRQAYDKGVNTLRFISKSRPIRGDNYYPCVISVSGYEQEVNIAGFKPELGGLGKRASVRIRFADFPDNDALTDKYMTERISGAAQINEGGYNPKDRGSFWTKFKARTPNYSGRPLRVIEGYLNSAGAVVPVRTRTYIISEIEGPNDGQVTILAKDILSLADNEKAKAPVQSRGRLRADITDSQTSFTLSEPGVGNAEYPASGWIVIGSEIMSFTRTNNTFTVVRGRKGTQASSHSVDDSVQLCFNVANQRADIVIRNLLRDYAGIPTAYIPFAEWQAEFDRWGANLVLNATICKPEGVVKLLSEICELGITIWWDEVAQLIRLRLNHPPEQVPVTLDDRNNNITISRDDNDSDRATRVAMWTVQIDPTKALAEDNFIRGYYSVGLEEESPNFYNQTITKTIFCRWLNQGNDTASKITTGRLLNRYRRAPVTYVVTVDAKDSIPLVDDVTLVSHVSTDITGRPVPQLTQVSYRQDDWIKGRIEYKLQSFTYDGRYGFITENSRPNYNASSEAQKIRGAYFVGPSLTFADGAPPYQFV